MGLADSVSPGVLGAGFGITVEAWASAEGRRERPRRAATSKLGVTRFPALYGGGL